MNQHIIVTPAIFDALVQAQLLVAIPPHDRTTWITWGVELDNGNVACTLIENETVTEE